MNEEERKKYQRLTNEYEKITYRCKCGHSVVIPKTSKKDYAICK